MSMPEAINQFPCSGCGGQMVFDSDTQHMKCVYCGLEVPVENTNQAPVEHELDFDAIDRDASRDWGTAQQTIHCENCGGEVLIPPHQTATSCPFCDSPKVLPQGTPDSIRPESIIPFHISKEKAIASFLQWKKKKWFMPNYFKKEHTVSKLTGIYVPFWTFDSSTYSTYSAEVGVYHYRTETRTRTVDGKTETYTEQVRYTVWHHTSGNYDRWFDDVLIPASTQHEAGLLKKFKDFQLKQLIPYRPEYLSGFIAERYSVPLRSGWSSAQDQMSNDLNSDIRRKIGGDEIQNLNISTSFSDSTYKHILLPLWSAVYSYKGKVYRYLVNGETGHVSGHVPRSPIKIACFTLACLAAVVLLFLYFQKK
ncbi:hypothetical protein [Paenibacillus sp. KN14-4R]|uniref:hypothetical protein n=1 Tax=Paenibacillus sp. KN14-4R TaxID=3445773 RepID=UPI003FA02928